MADETLWRAVLQPTPLMSDQISFEPKDISTVVMLRRLRSVGIADEELRHLLDLLQRSGRSEKLSELRRIRFQLLTRLHEQQQALDALDHYADALKKAFE